MNPTRRPETPGGNERFDRVRGFVADHRRQVILAAAAVVLLYLAIAAGTLLAARSSALAGIQRLEGLREDADPSEILRGEGAAALGAAHQDVERALGLVSSPVVAPLRGVPVLGRQVRSFGSLATAASHILEVGADGLEQAGQLLDRDRVVGPERVELVRDLEALAGRMEARISGLDLGPAEGLVSPLSDARFQLEGVRDGITSAKLSAAALGSFLEGPTRYLVLASNNAEMRAGSGMFLDAGLLTVAQGRMDIGELFRTKSLRLPPEAVDADGDLQERWGWLEPSQEWRSLGASPRFEQTAELAARMWEAAKGEGVDGVLALDVKGLAALLEVTGSIEVAGRPLHAGNVVELLLHDQYVEAASPDFGESERQERLGSVAGAVLNAFESGGWDPATLATSLRDAARGRHLMVWSARPAEQQGWEAAGADGGLGGDSVLVSLLNRGGNKLDQFIEIQAAIDDRDVDAGTEITVRLRLQNTTPPGEPRYVAGPHPLLDVAAGTYAGIVSVTIPGIASGVQMEGIDSPATEGPDGKTYVIAGFVRFEAGEQRDVTVRFVVPEWFQALRVEPSARVPPISWAHAGSMWADTAARDVRI